MESIHPSCEWLQTNRFGSFSMGSVDRIPRRKYHSLLCLRDPGKGDPLNTLVDLGEYFEIGKELFMLHSMDFGGRIEPKGFMHLKAFDASPCPKWTYDVGGMKVVRTLSVDPDRDIVRIHYQISSVSKSVQLRLRPYVACRPMHSLANSNPFLNGNATPVGGSKDKAETLSFRFYDSLPKIRMRVSGVSMPYVRRGEWVDRVHYNTEQDRGYPSYEDLYVPGEFEYLIKSDCNFVFEMGVDELDAKAPAAPQEVKYPSLLNRLEAAAEQYRLTTKSGFHSLIAGYPWFGHWGRDTFVSLPGFYLNTGNAEDGRTAVEVLRSYGELILGGLHRAEVNMTGADTPLLYIRAVQELKNFGPLASYLEFMPTVCKILNALKGGVDRRIHVSPDCGLWVDHGRWAMTWMDVMLEGQAVTPRSGFAVDLNALFLNAVQFALDWAKTNDDKFTREWAPLREKGDDAFLKRFWSDKFGYLADTHNGETADFSLRPNQLWALALPHSPVSKERGAKILEIIQKELLTPVGLRTLSPKDPKYRGRYHGAVRDRDLAYHQGSVWPWLLGIYSDALIHIYGVKKVKEQLTPIIKRLTQHIEHEACLGQISEIFDGDAPHQPGGAPAQAWSVAELLRVLRGMES